MRPRYPQRTLTRIFLLLTALGTLSIGRAQAQLRRYVTTTGTATAPGPPVGTPAPLTYRGPSTT